MPVVRVGWSIPTNEIRNIAFSKSGGYVSIISRDGSVAHYDSYGERHFSTIIAGADRTVASPDGSYTLAYSFRNPANTTLTFLDASGAVYWQMDVSGAVWSADAGLCKDGSCFVIGTGSRHVYVITVGHNTKRFRRWRTDGAVCSVTLDSACKNITYGTWQTSSICRLNLEGHKDWEVEPDPANLQYVQSLGNSDRLFIRSIPNNSSLDGEAALMEPDGTSLTPLRLDASRVIHAIPSPDGEYVCVSHCKTIQHSGKSMIEKHATLYDCEGRQLWDKGSILLQATPILVTKGGFVLVSSGKNALLAVSPAGKIEQVCKLPAAVVGSTASWDGSRAMITCANGRAYCLSVLH